MDGGITSNFPIHLFDGAVPCRPTFALNLLYPGDDLSIEEYRDCDADSSRARPGNARTLGDTDKRIAEAGLIDLIMPFANSDRVRFYKAPASGKAVAQLAGLAMRVVKTARTLADVSHFDQTGTRDRVVHIRLTGAEGGFNLDMDAATIASINNKGSMADTVLTSRFDPHQVSDQLDQDGPPRFQLDWTNHRQVRLNGLIAAHDLLTSRFHDSWQPQPPAGVQISTTLTRDLLTPGSHFAGVTLQLDAMGSLPAPDPDPIDRVLRPMAVLRIAPVDQRSPRHPAPLAQRSAAH